MERETIATSSSRERGEEGAATRALGGRVAPLVLFDRAGRCVHTNDAFDQALGALLTAERTLAPRIAHVLDWTRLLARGFAGETSEIPAHLVTLDATHGGHVATMRLTGAVTPIRDTSGLVSFVSLMFRDAPDERDAETHTSAPRALPALDPVERARRDALLSTLSHELRTPLNAIIGFSAILRDGQVPLGTPTYAEFLGDIVTSGRTLLALVDDAVDLARLEAGALDLRPAPSSTTRLVNEACLAMRELSVEQDVRVEVHRDSNLDVVTIDPGRFRQVVQNLLGGCLALTPAGGHVRISTHTLDEARFALEVADDGLGLGPDDLARIFVPFTKLGTNLETARRYTGLGLTLAHRLVGAMGGTLTAMSAHGTGTTFELVLPRVHAPAEPTR